MDNLLDKNFTIDKSTWIKVKLGDVVAEPKESVKDFSKEQIEHVVGLEHINSEDIHLRRSESMEESTTFTKKFATGDVLFGRRRAYLKKAAQASFSGVCSGDITVMRVKDGLSAELLPFVIHNEKFFDYAITHSAGGLSPRVKFKDLANYEFLLPPKEQQAQLAELLWAMDDVIEADTKTAMLLDLLLHSKMKELLAPSTTLTDGKEWVKLKLLAKFVDYRGKTPKKTDSGIRLITAKNIRDGWIDKSPEEFISELDYEPWMRRGIPQNGDVLFTTEAPLGNASLVNFHEKFALAQRVICLQPNKLVCGQYLFYSLRSPSFRNTIISKSTGTTVSGIRAASLKEIKIYIPPLTVQKSIADNLKVTEFTKNETKLKVLTSKSLQKALINQVF